MKKKQNRLILFSFVFLTSYLDELKVVSPPSPSFSVYDKIQCINNIAFFDPFSLYICICLSCWSFRRHAFDPGEGLGQRNLLFVLHALNLWYIYPHKIPFLSKKKEKEISTCKIYFISDGSSTMFTFNRNRRLASPRLKKFEIHGRS